MKYNFKKMIYILLILAFNHFFWARILPLIVFGTHSLHYATDFFVKKAPTGIAIALITCTPFMNKILDKILIKLPKQNIKEE